MEKANIDRDFVCVLFPGIVKNDEKALQCLGGIRKISQVYSQPTKKRLGLSYQPDNPFITKIYADGRRTAGVLLKVKVKKKKENNEVTREVMSTTVVGRVKKIYKFESMCDFQYVPVQIEGTETGQPKCLLDQILPAGLDNFSFMTEPSPLYIVPSHYTRSDRPTNYAYTDKRYPISERNESPERDDDVHHRRRSDRAAHIVRYTFNLIDDLPTEPHEFYINQKNNKVAIFPLLENEYETVKKLFENRPIMSQNLIKYLTKIKTSSLKIILPCLSIYMKNGPWRMLWVRFGYDPRKNPEARQYQTLDFRLRHQAGVHSMVMTRDQVVHYKKADRVSRLSRRAREDALSFEHVCEGAVVFRPGMAPSQRQIFYQYCDVKVPEVEEIIAEEPSPGYLCHQKRGWLPPNTDHTCRDHIFRYVKQALLASHSADINFEDGSSDDDSNSDDDDDDEDADEASNT